MHGRRGQNTGQKNRAETAQEAAGTGQEEQLFHLPGNLSEQREGKDGVKNQNPQQSAWKLTALPPEGQEQGTLLSNPGSREVAQETKQLRSEKQTAKGQALTPSTGHPRAHDTPRHRIPSAQDTPRDMVAPGTGHPQHRTPPRTWYPQAQDTLRTGHPQRQGTPSIGHPQQRTPPGTGHIQHRTPLGTGHLHPPGSVRGPGLGVQPLGCHHPQWLMPGPSSDRAGGTAEDNWNTIGVSWTVPHVGISHV